MRYNLITGAEPGVAVGCWLRLSHAGGTGLAGPGLLIALLKIMQKHEQWGFAVMKHFKCVSALPASLLMHSVKECFGGCC